MDLRVLFLPSYLARSTNQCTCQCMDFITDADKFALKACIAINLASYLQPAQHTHIHIHTTV